VSERGCGLNDRFVHFGLPDQENNKSPLGIRYKKDYDRAMADYTAAIGPNIGK
jgi:hypothetical protein